MNILLIIAGAGLILAAAFILKGRKKQAERNARYRAPRTALNLSRDRSGPGRSRGSGTQARYLAKPRPSSPAAPILLGVVLMVLGLWLAAAYIRPSAESAETEAAAAPAAPPPPPQVGTLAGRLNTPEPPAPPPPSAPPLPPALPPVADGARAVALAQFADGQTDGSALNQIGLMPAARQASSPAPPAPPAPTAPTPEARAAATAPAARPPAPADRPPSTVAQAAQTSSAPSAAQPNSNLVRALADPPPVPGSPPAAPGTAHPGILSNTGGFTVHLGSFVDQANAEKLRAKLVAAGEAAAISEITMDGRRWYRVLSGRFNTRAAADSHGRNLRRRGLIDENGPFIVKPINAEN